MDKLPFREPPDGLEQVFVVDVIERALDVSVQHPGFAAPVGYGPDIEDGVMATASGPKAVAAGLELGFPFRFQRIFEPRLEAAVEDSWNA